jgi:hypothetical protein
VEAPPSSWADRPSRVTESARSVPRARASAEPDDTPGVVIGDATVMALYGLIFASVAAGRPDICGHRDDAGGSPPTSRCERR